MDAIQIVLGVAILIVSVLLVILVIFQQSQRTGLNSTIGGGSGETFLAKNKSRSTEAKLARLTKILTVAFFVLVVVANLFAART